MMKGDVTGEENDDKNLRETRVIEEVAGKVEVFHPSLEATNSNQIQLPQKKTKTKKS